MIKGCLLIYGQAVFAERYRAAASNEFFAAELPLRPTAGGAPEGRMPPGVHQESIEPVEGPQMNVPDFGVQEEPAFLHLLFQQTGGEYDLVHCRKAAEALDRSQCDQRIEAQGVGDGQVLAHGNQIDRAVQDPRRHVIRHNPKPGLFHSAIEITLQSPAHGMIASESLWNVSPHRLQFIFPLVQNFR